MSFRLSASGIIETAGNGGFLFLTCEGVNKLASITQEKIHILKNPNDSSLSPWYKVDFGDTLYTPEWIFHKNELKRF